LNKVVSRNDACWCGSELKYKKCHMDSDLAKNKAASPIAATTPAPVKVKKNPLVLDADEIVKMKKACAFNAQLMDYIRDKIKPDVTTNSIDKLIHAYTLDHGHIPACLGYHGFPKTYCASVNEVICHGIPSEYVLKSGDIVNIDLTSIVDGFHGDQSEMFMIGDVTPEARKLCEVAYDAMFAGIKAIVPMQPVGLVGRAIQEFVEPLGYGIVRSYQGHGIGKKFHQDPPVPHFRTSEGMRYTAEPGMCFTVEPMINLGTYETVLDKKDGWTVRTRDGSLSAQWEHTILVTPTGYEILTKCKGKPSIHS
jgi:methionyl aminopeptidase